MRLKEHSHWLVPMQCLKKFVATLREALWKIDLNFTFRMEQFLLLTCLATFLNVAKYVSLGTISCNLPSQGVARQIA